MYFALAEKKSLESSKGRLHFPTGYISAKTMQDFPNISTRKRGTNYKMTSNLYRSYFTVPRLSSHPKKNMFRKYFAVIFSLSRCRGWLQITYEINLGKFLDNISYDLRYYHSIVGWKKMIFCTMFQTSFEKPTFENHITVAGTFKQPHV